MSAYAVKLASFCPYGDAELRRSEVTGGHGREGAPEQRPGGDAEGEGEHRVAERGDAVGDEVQLAEPARGDGEGGAVCDGLADRRRPPVLHEGQRLGDGHGGQAPDGELDGQPPGPGNGLVPGQRGGAGLQLAGDQRRAPEQADEEGRQEVDPGAEQEQQRISVAVQRHGEPAGQVRAAAMAAVEPAGGEQGGQVRAGDREHDRVRRHRREGGNGLGAELPPGEPGHV
jgi:hypothetical protein